MVNNNWEYRDLSSRKYDQTRNVEKMDQRPKHKGIKQETRNLGEDL